jgi:glutamyl-tRNA synthetase
MLRFASSPTSDMHISTLRVALLNYIVSKQKNEGLIVRIEDMDTEKNIEAKEQEILDILSLFGIEYSQVAYQSQNSRFYTAMALQLIHEKKAFSCFCSPEWIEKKIQESKKANKPYRYDGACENLPAELVIDNTNPFKVRIKEPQNKNPNNIDSFVIMKEDKTPTTDFRCAVDDMLSDISMVIRTKEHIDSTPKQEHIRASLNYDKQIKYVHLPAIDNDYSVKWLLEEGYLPEAISNYLISIGNKPQKEIFTSNEAIEWFDLEKISNSPASFDIDKLKHINKEHLKHLDPKELSRYVGFADEEIGELAKLYLTEVATTKELRSKIKSIFAPKDIPDDLKKQADLMVQAVKNAPYFDQYDQFENYIISELGIDKGSFVKVFSLLLTGVDSSANISQLYKYLKNYIGEIIK